MRRWLVVIITLLALPLTACSIPPTTTAPTVAPTVTVPAVPLSPVSPASHPTQSKVEAELTVFAAASLTEAFREIGRGFETTNSGVRVTFNFAGSQQLVQQIIQGAPADVFASAAPRQMDQAVEAGSVKRDSARTFVRNRLVAIYPKDDPTGLQTLSDLAQPGVKIVLAAKEVPVGQYALDFLDKATKDPALGETFKSWVLKNVVSYEENVRAVLGKVSLGEADAGIVYTSDITGEASAGVGRIEIPDTLNTIAVYPIAPVATAKNPVLAQAFVDYVRGPEGQRILAKYGFIPTLGAE